MRQHPIIAALLLTSMTMAPAISAFGEIRGTAGGAAPYLREGLGARIAGMGNAGTASAEGADAAYWNPAALAEMKGPGIASQTSVLGLGRAWHFVDYCHPFPVEDTRAALGISWISFSSGSDIEVRTTNQLEPDATLADTETAIMISGAYELGMNLAMGVNVKFLSHQLGDSSGNGQGFDVSLWNALSGEFRWGLMLQDAYSYLSWSERYSEKLPVVARVGAARSLFDQSLLIAAEIGVEYAQTLQPLNHIGYHLGAEYKIADFALRAGWDTDRWTAGAGWRFVHSENAALCFDYAAAGERIPEEGLRHLFSLVMDF